MVFFFCGSRLVGYSIGFFGRPVGGLVGCWVPCLWLAVTVAAVVVVIVIVVVVVVVVVVDVVVVVALDVIIVVVVLVGLCPACACGPYADQDVHRQIIHTAC